MTIQKDVLFISVEQEIKHRARTSRYSLDYIHKQWQNVEGTCWHLLHTFSNQEIFGVEGCTVKWVTFSKGDKEVFYSVACLYIIFFAGKHLQSSCVLLYSLLYSTIKLQCAHSAPDFIILAFIMLDNFTHQGKF